MYETRNKHFLLETYPWSASPNLRKCTMLYDFILIT